MEYVHNVLLSLLQQCAVLSDLLFQAGLDAQEHLVLLVLTLHLTADAGQLLLHGVNLHLDLLQQAAVARFGFCQGVFQRVFLEVEMQEFRTRALPVPARSEEGRARSDPAPRTVLSCACSSISRFCSSRLNSVTWWLLVWMSWLLEVTCRLTSSICRSQTPNTVSE